MLREGLTRYHEPDLVDTLAGKHISKFRGGPSLQVVAGKLNHQRSAGDNETIK